MNWNPVNGTCANCGDNEAAHEWRCTKCGTQSFELGTCGCGAVHLPKSACECHKSISLYCAAPKRRLTPEQYSAEQQMREFFTHDGYDWHDAEVKRLSRAWMS